MLEVLLHTGGIMSTYSASLVFPGTSCSGEGPKVTTQQNHVIQAIAAHQLTGPKLYLIAGSTITTFLEANVVAMRWKNEVRPQITAEVDGRKVDLL